MMCGHRLFSTGLIDEPVTDMRLFDRLINTHVMYTANLQTEGPASQPDGHVIGREEPVKASDWQVMSGARMNIKLPFCVH